MVTSLQGLKSRGPEKKQGEPRGSPFSVDLQQKVSPYRDLSPSIPPGPPAVTIIVIIIVPIMIIVVIIVIIITVAIVTA